jgi:hypothetical protein
MIFRRFLPEIPSGAFPRRLASATCGELRLVLRYLVLKSDGLEFISEERLMPGHEIKARFLRYEPKDAGKVDFAVALHPPDRGRVAPDEWLSVFDSRFTKFATGWREILAGQPRRITKLLRRYGESSLDGEAFISTLTLSNLNISVLSSVDLVFEPVEPFDSLNLNVSVSHKGKVTDAHFDG